MSSFVAFPSISEDPSKRGACWDAAKWLKSTFESYGLDTQLLEGMEKKNRTRERRGRREKREEVEGRRREEDLLGEKRKK
jgi:hypothetical protein